MELAGGYLIYVFATCYDWELNSNLSKEWKTICHRTGASERPRFIHETKETVKVSNFSSIQHASDKCLAKTYNLLAKFSICFTQNNLTSCKLVPLSKTSPVSTNNSVVYCSHNRNMQLTEDMNSMDIKLSKILISLQFT